MIRFNDLELGKDADTGGQTLYVLELARALARLPEVSRVDVFTRRVIDTGVSPDYGETIEKIDDTLRVVRINAGPEEYIPKEQLWDHIEEFTDNIAAFFRENDAIPDIIHSHYADAGNAGALLAKSFGLPLIHTGHSLGRVKRHRLLASGLGSDQIETLYNMSRRIEAEELTLATADKVITSTHQEIEEQYELYHYYQPDNMSVIPPGTDLTTFMPPEGNELQSEIFADISRHLKEPKKPIILALSRPDKRKNITTLIEAYGQSEQLTGMANLMIVAGNRDDIDDLDDNAQEVFHDILVTIDRFDLYGKVAIPKHHSRQDVPLFYRIVALSKGVFVNPAITEPFGLTLIEAAASGLPIVATEDGGPQDIMNNCENGFLIDPFDASSITTALLNLLNSKQLWKQSADNGLAGVREHYSWDAHVKSYLKLIKPLVKRAEPLTLKPIRLTKGLYNDRAIVSDLDQNLIGDDESLQTLIGIIRKQRKSTKFVIATGRSLDSALKLMKKHRIPEPDILIASSGTEIFYAPKLTADKAWLNHIDYNWTPHKIRRLLTNFPGLKRQPKLEQTLFKLSYYIDPQIADIDEINQLLQEEDQSVNTQFAFGQCLDILPLRASKGLALRYIADRWQIPLERIFVAGGSGADEDMMRGNTLAAVVANRHHEELSNLIGGKRIYFAKQKLAAGIIEALTHYDFFNTCRAPQEPEQDDD